MSFSKHFSCVSKGTYLIWSINAALCTSSTILHCPREITIERSLFILIFCPGVQLCHPMKLNNIPMQTRILMTFENFELRIYTKIDINTCALTCFCFFYEKFVVVDQMSIAFRSWLPARSSVLSRPVAICISKARCSECGRWYLRWSCCPARQAIWYTDSVVGW